MERSVSQPASAGERGARGFTRHGVIGIGLIAIFWMINWGLEGPRSHWAFFPLWVGYCLTIDALVLRRTGTSLLTRGRRRYMGLFLVSAPVWWLFEILNARLQNWRYPGTEDFSAIGFIAWSTLSFTTVIPAVFGTAELASSFDFVKRLGKGPVIRPQGATPLLFFIAGWIMIALMLAWPHLFFPFVWLSVYFILEPINVWLGHLSLADWTKDGDWRPVIALWIGVLITAFFWEMWNFYSFPKWVYSVSWGGSLKIFEMPLLGYGGYLPFALELYAMYHLIAGLFGNKRTEYVRIQPESRES
jgi:hypothetical protein